MYVDSSADFVTPQVRFGGPKAEREGVEPSIPCGISAFQADALGHYATSPITSLLLHNNHLKAMI